MDPTPGEPHRRRPRYRGTHPRTFDERYKERAPDLYPDVVAHVRDAGRTPAGQHVPILVEEVLAALDPKPLEKGVDATLGYGGHAERLLARVRPGGALLGLDRDPIELPRAEARLRSLGYDASTLLVRKSSFAGLAAALDDVGWGDGVDFVLADLGVSSMQLDDPARGFSFKLDGPLDMRMNPTRGMSAAGLLERASVEALARLLVENADEPHAVAVATALAARRGSLDTTRALADAVRRALPRKLDADDAEASVRRVFQALRIEVNDEFGALDAFLRALPLALRAGGRVAVLSFHSGEDRRVKRELRRGLEAGVYASVSEDVVRPGAAERRANPRSSPAKLRWARRAGADPRAGPGSAPGILRP